MLYRIMRFMVRVSLHFYQKRIGWEGIENVPKNKPVLFAITHSNSFLDALPMASVFNRTVYCLARGDAFRKPLANKILRHFRVLPIFRQADSTEGYISKNEKTFEECQELFRQNQWILIFPEAFCTHQTSVQPLKKGFVNMTQRAWAEGIDLQVVPVSITYDSFSKWGKKCDVIFNKPIQSADIQGAAIEQATQLKDITYTRLAENFPSPLQYKGTKLLWGWFGPLLYYVGWVFQFPVYFLSQYLAKKKTQGTVFYDSAVVGLLCVLLLIYYLIGLVVGALIYIF
jgi:1-acyl-sn-glycerol-3-phosphate acyltransferase